MPSSVPGPAPWIALALALGLPACGGAPPVDVEALPRHRAPDAALTRHDTGPAVVFAPGAAWITGIESGDDWQAGTWVAAGPADAWPDDLERPTLAVGRVVERTDGWARLELAAAVEGVRSPTLTPSPLTSSTLPALTKRLVPVRSEAGTLRAPIGTGNLVTGHGSYGVLPPVSRIPAHRRIGAAFEGIVRLQPLDSGTSEIQTVLGRAPSDDDSLVLLGVEAARETRVDIVIERFDSDDELQADVADQLRDRLDAHDIGGVHVELAGALSDADVDARLGARHGDALLLVAHERSDGAVVVDSQIRRVRDQVAAPSLRALPDEPSPDAHEVTGAVLATVFQLRGQPARAAFVLEQTLAASEDPTHAWPQLGPALAMAWVDAWRTDLALEVVLTLEALVAHHGAENPHTPTLEAVLLAAEHVPEMSHEDLVARLEARHQRGDTVAVDAMEALARATNASRQWHQADLWLQRLRTAAEDLGPTATFDAALTAATLRTDRRGNDHIDYARLDALAEAAGPLHALEARVLRALEEVRTTGLVSSELTAVVDAIDGFGAPALGVRLLAEAARHAAPGQDLLVDRLILQAGAFAHAARRPARLIGLLTELERVRLSQGTSPVKGDLAGVYVERLAAADQRVELGRRALLRAREASDLQPSRDALLLARSLFLDVGDALNAAVAELRLARLELDAGRHQAAQAHVAAARTLEVAARDGALTAVRERLENELAEAMGQ